MRTGNNLFFSFVSVVDLYLYRLFRNYIKFKQTYTKAMFKQKKTNN